MVHLMVGDKLINRTQTDGPLKGQKEQESASCFLHENISRRSGSSNFRAPIVKMCVKSRGHDLCPPPSNQITLKFPNASHPDLIF